MKKLFKSLVCMAIAAALTLSTCSIAFAEESDDMSMEDLLALLEMLSSESDDSEDDGEQPADTESIVYTIDALSYEVPSDWTEEYDEEQGMHSYYASDFSAFLMVFMQNELNGESIEDPEIVAEIVESMSGDDSYAALESITVCGYPALWISTDAEGIPTDMAVIQVDDSIYMFAFVNLFGTSTYDLAYFVNGVSIEGADGETDLSAVADLIAGSSETEIEAQTQTPAETETEPTTPTESTTEGLDATASEELVLIDTEEFTVIVSDFSEDDYYAMTANVYIENNSDHNIYLSAYDSSINGYMCDIYLYETVSAGHKSNSDLHIYAGDLEANGITDISDIEFTLRIMDDDDWSLDDYVNEHFIIYPSGTDVPEQPAQEFVDDAIVLVDNDDITMVITGFGTDDYYFYASVYLENKTDKELSFGLDDSSAINGFEVYPYFYRTVLAGKKLNTKMQWYLTDLEDNKIDTVEDLELVIEVKDYNDWSADPIWEDTIMVQVP